LYVARTALRTLNSVIPQTQSGRQRWMSGDFTNDQLLALSVMLWIRSLTVGTQGLSGPDYRCSSICSELDQQLTEFCGGGILAWVKSSFYISGWKNFADIYSPDDYHFHNWEPVRSFPSYYIFI
jgi:hypothetical protein